VSESHSRAAASCVALCVWGALRQGVCAIACAVPLLFKRTCLKQQQTHEAQEPLGNTKTLCRCRVCFEATGEQPHRDAHRLVQAAVVRAALTAKTVEAYRQVYSWRTINCLELWGRVVAAQGAQGVLKPLVYPVVQLLQTAARLVPSPRWFPVRLRLARILNAVAAATGVYVPVATLLLEVLTWPGFSKPASGIGKCPELQLQLRLSKANLQSPAVQQQLVEQVRHVCAPGMLT
jgi:Noc2p family